MDPMRFWEGLQQVKLSQKLPHLEEDVLSLDRTGNWSTFFLRHLWHLADASGSSRGVLAFRLAAIQFL